MGACRPPRESGPAFAPQLRIAAPRWFKTPRRDATVARSAERVHAAPRQQTERDRMSTLPRDGLVAVVKRDCPTCEMTAPVLGELARRAGITVYSQDDPTFPETVPAPVDDQGLDVSHALKIEIVPTLVRFENGREIARTYGWDRGEWERVTGVAGL